LNILIHIIRWAKS